MEFNYTSTHLQTSVHWELCIPPSFWSLNAMQVPNCALRTVVTGRELDPVMSVTAQTISVSRTVWVTFVNNETTMLSREMQRNTKKCREIQRNAAKFREMQICRDILMTFMIFMTFMTHGNVIFYILAPTAFRKYSTWWVLQIFEEPWRILKKFVHACLVNLILAKVLSGSVLYVQHWIKVKVINERI